MRIRFSPFKVSVAIAVTATATLGGALAASAAVTQPAAACTVIKTSTADPNGSWRATRTRQCGDTRQQQIRARTVYATGTVSRLTETRTQNREVNTWVTVTENAERDTAYVSGTISSITTVIAACTETVTRHTVYPSGRVTDRTTVTPTC